MLGGLYLREELFQFLGGHFPQSNETAQQSQDKTPSIDTPVRPSFQDPQENIDDIPGDLFRFLVLQAGPQDPRHVTRPEVVLGTFIDNPTQVSCHIK